MDNNRRPDGFSHVVTGIQYNPTRHNLKIISEDKTIHVLGTHIITDDWMIQGTWKLVYNIIIPGT